ncbi:MAG: hypothetical protein GYB66_01675 [Chloroflexi bacterium]|nr:hypothetical protein [Chloroflexota bacterium]
MKRITQLLIAILLLSQSPAIVVSRAAREAPAPPPQTNMPRPHLGYGIHFAPHTNSDPGLVDALGMQWVKIYDPGQVRQHPGKKILFRMDMRWPQDWDQFKRDIRARTQGLLAMGEVDAIEVHNEPNLRIEWGEVPDAWQYTQMLRVAYGEIKAVAPNVLVISGGLASTITTGDGRAIGDLEFAREMFENGAGDYFDAFGYHPYGYNAPPEQAPDPGTLNFRRTELMRALMQEYDLGDKQIWITEFGWLRNPSEEGVDCAPDSPQMREYAWMQVDGRTQADYIVRAFDYADRNWEYVGPMFLWNLNWSLLPIGVLAMCNHMRWFSLLSPNGEPTLAFSRVASMPKRAAQLSPDMTLVADQMTAEIGVTCPGLVQVGQFEVTNSGYPGTFTATISPAQSLNGPVIDVSPETARPGDIVTVFADTTGLTAGMYIIYINVQTTISGQPIAQNLRGYVIVSESFSACR